VRILVSLAASLFAFAGGIAADLDSQVKNWKPGDEVPHRLLSFPDGNVPPLSLMRTDAYDEAFTVRPYIHKIDNDALLEEIVFDPRSERGAFEAAVVTVIDHKGLVWFSKILAKRDSTRWEHDAFRQILRSPFARTSVAFISKDAMTEANARQALEEIKAKLDKGESWKAAYGSVADAYPDTERRKREPGVPTTLIGYMYSGWVSAFGFDFSSLHITSTVPAALFAAAIRSGKGGRIVSTPSGQYLVYVYELYSPGP